MIAKVTGLSTVKRMQEYAESFQGEVNETNERPRGSLSEDTNKPLILRGANICMYAVRDAFQGEEIHLDRSNFLHGKRKSSKAYDFRETRVGFQRSSPQNNFRRIIAAKIEQDNFCFDTVSYVTESSCVLDLDLLLALLNSQFLDWYFRLGSTNSKINEYQFKALPVPTFHEAKDTEIEWKHLMESGDWKKIRSMLCHHCVEPGTMPESVANALSELSQRVQEIESVRVLKSRSERSRLDPKSQPIQDVIDDVLFQVYGLSADEADHIRSRLKDML